LSSAKTFSTEKYFVWFYFLFVRFLTSLTDFSR
jgi:hypothetical protein